jgi:hypothetical protein
MYVLPRLQEAERRLQEFERGHEEVVELSFHNPWTARAEARQRRRETTTFQVNSPHLEFRHSDETVVAALLTLWERLQSSARRGPDNGPIGLGQSRTREAISARKRRQREKNQYRDSSGEEYYSTDGCPWERDHCSIMLGRPVLEDEPSSTVAKHDVSTSRDSGHDW